MSQERKGYTKNKEQFYSKLPENIIPMTEYISWKKPITVYCEKCGTTHTFAEAKYAVTRKCHGCYLLDIREESKKKLIPILEDNGFSLVEWTLGSEKALVKCERCGSIVEREVGGVIRHKRVFCFDCMKQETRTKKVSQLSDKQKEKQKEDRDNQRRSRMKKELDDLIGNYIADYDVINVSEDLQSVVLRHKVCGHEFLTRKAAMKKGYGCKICSKRGVSKAAQDIENYLKANDIPFEREKRFEDCRRKNPLPFDFFVPSSNLLIEYNGEQHYRATELFGGEKKLELYQERDRIKRQFAKTHGYRLLIIPWYRDPIPMLRDEINRE